jgi:hypothetical protein
MTDKEKNLKILKTLKTGLYCYRVYNPKSKKIELRFTEYHKYFGNKKNLFKVI